MTLIRGTIGISHINMQFTAKFSSESKPKIPVTMMNVCSWWLVMSGFSYNSYETGESIHMYVSRPSLHCSGGEQKNVNRINESKFSAQGTNVIYSELITNIFIVES